MSSLQWGYTISNNNHNSINSQQRQVSNNNSAKTTFMEFMQKSPAEKMRAMILKEMNLTEEQIKNLSPEQRKKVEEEILERMKKKLEVSDY